MSLILEALKKLEREKQAPDRGFLVMAHVPWATAAGRGARWPWIGGSLLVLLVAALAVAFFGKGRAPERSKAAPGLEAAATPAPPPAAVPQLKVPPPGSSLTDPQGSDLRSGPAGAYRGPDARIVATPPPRAAASSDDPPVAPTPGAAGPSTDTARAPAAQAPPREKAAPPGLELRLNAISERDGRPVAILNDRLVREGDIFDGILVVRIGEAEVEVEVEGKRRIVTF